jgi:FlaG/FlaF family flagellin (archaellin)
LSGEPPFRLILVYEPEEACRTRLVAAGLAGEAAAEIAPYLAQASDLEDYRAEIELAFRSEGASVDFVSLDAFASDPRSCLGGPGRSVLWALTDGFAYFRGSGIPAFAAMAGMPHFGSAAQAYYLCQDKFKCTALAAAAGLTVPPTLLARGRNILAGCGPALPAGPLFAKPNRLGAKIGIFGDSRCDTLADALALSARLQARYGDDAVIQGFVAGADVRVSYIDLGLPLAAALGIARLAGTAGGETGGAFMTMRDNASLSGARDTEGTTTRFGARQTKGFVPKLVDLRTAAESDEKAAATVDGITAMVVKAMPLFGLGGYFTFDFRVGEDGSAHFLEFEVCPAVTIFDFQTYLRTTYGVGLGAALHKAVVRRIAAGSTGC